MDRISIWGQQSRRYCGDDWVGRFAREWKILIWYDKELPKDHYV